MGVKRAGPKCGTARLPLRREPFKYLLPTCTPITSFIMCYDLVWCMIGHSQRKRERRRLARSAMDRNPPKPHYPPRPSISTEPRNPQRQCPLFSPNFPAELRIQIYEAVLGDPNRFMHVIPFNDHSNWVGRRRCNNTNARDGPTFQHSCFGIVISSNRLSTQQMSVFESDDQLLALPLTCHRM
jgi:hypothetical protein